MYRYDVIIIMMAETSPNIRDYRASTPVVGLCKSQAVRAFVESNYRALIPERF